MNPQRTRTIEHIASVLGIKLELAPLRLEEVLELP